MLILAAIVVTALITRAFCGRKYRLAFRDLARCMAPGTLWLNRARRADVLDEARLMRFDLTIGIQQDGKTEVPFLYHSHGRSWTSLSRKDRRRIMYALHHHYLESDDIVGRDGIWMNDAQKALADD
jgi:hypothetical protein